MSMNVVALTIAGSDSSGGAGIQADLKTFSAFGVYGASALTALTAQNTQGVRAIVDLEPSFIAQQIDSVAEDMPVAAAKTGMLSRAAVIEAVVERLRVWRIPHLVVDPVMVAASGDVLLEPAAIASIRERLIPLATVVTPNLREAELLTGLQIKGITVMREAAQMLVRMGAHAALVKGGRLPGGEAIDVLCLEGTTREFRAPRIAIERAHGAGCTLSAAIAASLALGDRLEDAVAAAKDYVSRALATAPKLGHDSTPLNHLLPGGKVRP
jgi:hydroxymethylpyrimidine/phosphomethylpyrimidine kinase